ncbi:MAG TPA: DinB family protein [Chitinophagaceae bacterium]|nr:DinB family protein [Chitinophagaceae bacterium]
MTTQTQLLLALWVEARTRFSNQLESFTEDDLKKKLLPSQNSIGFLIRHIGDVEWLFAKNVFGASDLHVSARTVIEKHDTGEWTNLMELKEYVNTSFASLKSIVEKQTDSDWSNTITTKEFGTKTKAEAFGRIVSHTAYHAGQIAIIYKYGTFKTDNHTNE